MGSATAAGLPLFAQAIPPQAAPFAGVVADRFAPGRLLSAGWLTQTVLAGLLALSLPPPGALLAAVFVVALLDTPLWGIHLTRLSSSHDDTSRERALPEIDGRVPCLVRH